MVNYVLATNRTIKTIHWNKSYFKLMNCLSLETSSEYFQTRVDHW